MHPRVVAIVIALLGLAMLLQACSGISATVSYRVEIATPIPAFAATDQASALQARATRQASEGRMSELAAESTAVVLQMTQAAATEAYFSRQTEQSQAATSTAAQQALEGTATAQVERLAEQRESERQTLLFRTWAGRIALVILFAVGLFMRLANRPVVITPDGKGGFNVFDISRSLQPGASVSKDGKILTAGGANDQHIQNQVTARAQAAELMLAANSGQVVHSNQRRAVLRHALQAGQPQTSSPAGEIIDAEVTIIPPGDPRVRPLLDEVEPKLLNGGE